MQIFDNSVAINRHYLLNKTAEFQMIWDPMTLKWRHYTLLLPVIVCRYPLT